VVKWFTLRLRLGAGELGGGSHLDSVLSDLVLPHDPADPSIVA
jgi:hypothetical protein